MIGLSDQPKGRFESRNAAGQVRETFTHRPMETLNQRHIEFHPPAERARSSSVRSIVPLTRLRMTPDHLVRRRLLDDSANRHLWPCEHSAASLFTCAPGCLTEHPTNTVGAADQPLVKSRSAQSGKQHALTMVTSRLASLRSRCSLPYQPQPSGDYDRHRQKGGLCDGLSRGFHRETLAPHRTSFASPSPHELFVTAALSFAVLRQRFVRPTRRHTPSPGESTHLMRSCAEMVLKIDIPLLLFLI